MLRKRVIVCLDVKDGRVVKGTRFVNLRDVGDPAELAQRYQNEGADEIVFLDISASVEGRKTLLDAVERTARRLFVPLTVGGGVSNVEDVERALRAGADKIAMNSAAVKRPQLVEAASRRFGRQCVVVSIDALGSRVFTHGGTRPTTLDARTWAQTCAQHGAGEILITSINADGGRVGYDVALTASIATAVNVPVIASGGAGSPEHMRDVLLESGAQAALAAGIFHDGTTTVSEVKEVMSRAGIPVRNG